MELLSTVVTLGTIRPEDSGDVRKPICFSIKLRSDQVIAKSPTVWEFLPGVNTLDMLRTPSWASKRHSITHHALLPHPHIIICASFISSTDCTIFNV